MLMNDRNYLELRTKVFIFFPICSRYSKKYFFLKKGLLLISFKTANFYWLCDICQLTELFRLTKKSTKFCHFQWKLKESAQILAKI